MVELNVCVLSLKKIQQATFMTLEIIIGSGVSQTKTNISSLICVIHKVIQMTLFIEQQQTHRHRKQVGDYPRGKERGKSGV